ncbi:MAG: hypothetical protein AMXMBFR58_29610 [Phycisphaerae bacterium]
MNNQVHDPLDANTIQYTNTTGSTISAGKPVKIAGRYYIAITDIANNATGAVRTAHVARMAKATGSAITQGTALGWDSGNSRVTTDTTGGLLGYCFTAAASTDTEVEVLITDRPRIYSNLITPSAGELTADQMDVDTGWGVAPAGPTFALIINSSNVPRLPSTIVLLGSTDAGKVRVTHTDIATGDKLHILSHLFPIKN